MNVSSRNVISSLFKLVLNSKSGYVRQYHMKKPNRESR